MAGAAAASESMKALVLTNGRNSCVMQGISLCVCHLGWSEMQCYSFVKVAELLPQICTGRMPEQQKTPDGVLEEGR